MGIESYGGAAIFGSSVYVQRIPPERGSQHCGGAFEITGVLTGKDILSLLAAEAVLLSYADGITRTFVDNLGRTFPSVIFQGEYIPTPEGPTWDDAGVCLPYRAVFHGLV